MKKLIEALLNDPNGISEEAYMALVAMLEVLSLQASETNIIGREAADMLERVKNCDATDGRFYFAEDREE